MNRRSFFRTAAVGAAVVALAPTTLAAIQPTPVIACDFGAIGGDFTALSVCGKSASEAGRQLSKVLAALAEGVKAAEAPLVAMDQTARRLAAL